MQPLSVHPNWTAAAAVYPYSAGLDAALTFTSTYGDEVKLAKRVGDNLFVPRRFAPSLGQDFRRENFLGAIDCKIKPYPDQAQVIDRSLQLLGQDVSHVIEAPTGWGKTVVGSTIAARFGQATLVVVPKQDLMDSWYETLVNLLGIPASQIGIAQANKLEYKGKRFVLGMIQSLVRPGKYDNDFWNYFGLLIVDETHKVAAETFREVNFLCPAKYRIGLSATPKRGDGKTPVIDGHIGTVMARGTVIPMKPKILVKHSNYKLPAWVNTADPGRMMGAYVQMAKDHSRNMIFVDFTKAAYIKGRNIVLMADTTDHLKVMSSLLINNGIPPGDIGFYWGELAKNKILLRTNANKRVILATYGMCAEGTNYPRWDTLAYLTPRSNIKQPLGRILRQMEGKPDPVCLDIIDKDRIFNGFYHKREKQYYELGANITRLQ